MVEKDYQDINMVTPQKKFLAQLSTVVLKYAQEHKPYDSACAKLEFKDKLEALEKESERRYGFVKIENIKCGMTDVELEKYGDEDRFEFIEDQEDVQDKVIEGSRTQVVIGHTLSYRCKPRGHGISVFIPIAEYNEMKKKEKK